MSKTENNAPNIVLIVTDQQRWDTLGCLGYDHVITPHIDRLAARITAIDGLGRRDGRGYRRAGRAGKADDGLVRKDAEAAVRKHSERCAITRMGAYILSAASSELVMSKKGDADGLSWDALFNRFGIGLAVRRIQAHQGGISDWDILRHRRASFPLDSHPDGLNRIIGEMKDRRAKENNPR